MTLSEKIKNHEYLFSFLLIVFTVIIANLHAVFGLDMLWQDDNAKYNFFVNDIDTKHNPQFIGLKLQLKWFFIKIFSTHSIETARLLMLLVFMVPLSCLIYVFNRKFLRLSFWVSITSAILINIIPKQFQIPAFLDGSYPAMAMLVFLTTLIITGLYLQSPKYKFLLLFLVTIGWFLVCDFTNEMCFFLFPVMLYFIYSSDAAPRFKYYLYSILSVIMLLRLLVYFQSFGAVSNKIPVEHSIGEIASRVIKSVDWWLPFRSSQAVTIAIGLIVFVILIYSFARSLKQAKDDNSVSRAFIFYGAWFVLCSSPFWAVAPYVVPRHFYVSYIGLTTLTLIAFYQLLILSSRHRQTIATASLVAVLLFYGIQRYAINEERFSRLNKKNAILKSLLLEEIIGAETQIAVVNFIHLTGGWPDWSSGYLQYLLKTPGIRGAMGKEMNFYDPFNLKHCGYRHRMSCLDSSKELIAFKRGKNAETIRMRYFLQWLSAKDRNSNWVIYGTNNDNKIHVVSTGSGFDSYEVTLSSLGLTAPQVLWGNYEVGSEDNHFKN